MDNLVDVFFDVDDFYAVFIPQWKKCLTDGKRQSRNE